jgi:DNA-binding transcriptional MerR regulator
MPNRQQAGTFLSGALAKATGVSPDTIRHYERIGVLPKAARTVSGYRVYPESAVERVLVIQRALRIGFSLAELSEVLRSRDAGGAPCHRVYEIASDKLGRLRVQIQTLTRLEQHLSGVLSDWEGRMKKAGPGERSHLLYSIAEAVRASGEEDSAVTKRKRHLRRRG